MFLRFVAFKKAVCCPSKGLKESKCKGQDLRRTIYLTDDLWRELHLLWRPNSNERTCGFLLGHLMGWNWYFTDCIYLFYVGELAWEFGHGQAQAL